MTYDDLEGAFRALRSHLRAHGVRSISGFTRALEAEPDAIVRAVASWVGAMRDERGLGFVTAVLDERPRRYATRLRAAMPSEHEFALRARQWCAFFQSAPKLFAACEWLLEGARAVALLPVIVARCEPTRAAMLLRVVRSCVPTGTVADTEVLAGHEAVARRLSRFVETAPLLRALLDERAEWGSMPAAFIRFRVFGGPPPPALVSERIDEAGRGAA